MAADPRWLEILKASGGQAFALASAAGALLLAARWNWVPPLDPWMVHLATVLLVLGGVLWLVSVIAAINKFFAPKNWAIHWFKMWQQKRDVEKYVPHMNEYERKIISYLLAHNEKMFTTALDGGHANTLLGRGIVVRAVKPGQVFAQNDMPVAVPDHIWNVLVKHRDKFPYTPPPHGQVETYPWRVRYW